MGSCQGSIRMIDLPVLSTVAEDGDSLSGSQPVWCCKPETCALGDCLSDLIVGATGALSCNQHCPTSHMSLSCGSRLTARRYSVRWSDDDALAESSSVASDEELHFLTARGYQTLRKEMGDVAKIPANCAEPAGPSFHAITHPEEACTEDAFMEFLEDD